MVGCQKLNWWWRKEIRVADYNSAVFWRKVILVPSDFEIWGFKGFFLPFCSGVKSYWCRFEKKEKSHHGALALVCEKSHNGALNCAKCKI